MTTPINSDLVYQVQKWPRQLFKLEAAAESGLLADVLNVRTEGAWPALVRELFGRLYGIGTTKLEQPVAGCEWAGELHEQVENLAEWLQLADRVQGDAWRAAMGAAKIAEALAENMPKMPDSSIDEQLAQAETLRELGAEDAALLSEGAAEEARARGAAVLSWMRHNHGASIRSTLRRAAAQAAAEVAQVEQGIAGLGAGDTAAPLERRAMVALLARDERIRRIAMLAGRLRLQVARKQRTRVDSERREVVSVTKGDDIQRLLASEAGMLGHPATRPFVLERIAERRALQYELGGKATKVRGPVVYLLDNSSSMRGVREEWSKACALAMMEVARIQRRAFAIAFFNTAIVEAFYFEAGEPSQERILALLSVAARGGTKIAAALEWARALIVEGGATGWKPASNSDVVLITDGDDDSEISVPAAALRQHGASIYTVSIECPVSPDLRAVSVDAVSVGRGDMAGATEKLDGLFSM